MWGLSISWEGMGPGRERGARPEVPRDSWMGVWMGAGAGGTWRRKVRKAGDPLPSFRGSVTGRMGEPFPETEKPTLLFFMWEKMSPDIIAIKCQVDKGEVMDYNSNVTWLWL